MELPSSLRVATFLQEERQTAPTAVRGQTPLSAFPAPSQRGDGARMGARAYYRRGPNRSSCANSSLSLLTLKPCLPDYSLRIAVHVQGVPAPTENEQALPLLIPPLQ